VSSVRVAIVQLSSTDDVADNLKQTIELVNRAADRGAAIHRAA
jgi:predicted amidohydrolase